MANLFTQDPSLILEAFADAIEGGNSYAGGDVQKGIPGLYSSDRGLRGATDTPLTVVGSSTSTTTFDVATADSRRSRFLTEKGPPFFAVCTTSGGSTSILDERRKITGYNNTTKVFTIAPALSAAPVADDVFAIQEGFKRLPNQVDIEEAEDGYDRYFSIGIEEPPGELLLWFGDNSFTYRAIMYLRLRILKFARMQDAMASAITNMAIIRGALVRREHYESTYTRALLPVGGSVDIEEDEQKIIATDRYQLIYRVDGTAV